MQRVTACSAEVRIVKARGTFQSWAEMFDLMMAEKNVLSTVGDGKCSNIINHHNVKAEKSTFRKATRGGGRQ